MCLLCTKVDTNTIPNPKYNPQDHAGVIPDYKARINPWALLVRYPKIKPTNKNSLRLGLIYQSNDYPLIVRFS